MTSRRIYGNRAKETAKRYAERLRRRALHDAFRRDLRIELLESRQLLAIDTPALLAIRPDDGELIRADGETTLNVAPRELRVLFNGGSNLDPATVAGIQITRSGTDRQFNHAEVASDFGTNGNVLLHFVAREFGLEQNGISLSFAKQDLGNGASPTITLIGRRANVTLNDNATTPTTAQELIAALNSNEQVSRLFVASLEGNPNQDITGISPTTFAPLVLSGAGAAQAHDDLGAVNPLRIRFTAKSPGIAGENLTIRVTSRNRGVAGNPGVVVQGNLITVDLNNNVANRTTAQGLINAINGSPAASTLVTASLETGSASEILGGLTFSNYRIALGGADIVVQPGFRAIDDAAGNQVVLRFAENLPDDQYRVDVYAYDDATRGITALRSLTDVDGDGVGDPLVPSVANSNRETVEFRLDLGAQVAAVVPQPVSRLVGGLTQATDTIDVYFNGDTLDPTSAENPTYYRLIDTRGTLTPSDDVVRLPQSVSYDTGTHTARLVFDDDGNSGTPFVLPTATYRLDIGQSDEPNDTISGAVQVGQLFATNSYQTVAYLGDSGGASDNGADVDLYRVDATAGSTLAIVVSPQPGLDLGIRLLRDDGATPVALPVDANGPGGVETLNTPPLPYTGEYYVEITGSAGVGSYALNLTSNSLPSASDTNSSFASATSLGVLGAAGQRVSAQIEPQTSLLLPQFPGGNDEPGHREIGPDPHSDTEGIGAVAPNAIDVIEYHFAVESTSTDPQGNPYVNLITEEEKVLVRGIYELY
ncbi:MAG: PPC domain-containing protein, partial [Planctomycetales bacterium]|nr:PPC domain-containing protein [Planctomycetales bacterium]